MRPSLPPRQLRDPADLGRVLREAREVVGALASGDPGPAPSSHPPPALRPLPGYPRPIYSRQGRVPTAALRGRGRGGGRRPSEVRASPASLMDCLDCRTSRPNPLGGMCLDVGLESRRPKWPQAGGVLPSPQNEASLHRLHLFYPPAGRPTLGRTPRPNTLLGDGSEMGRVRETVARLTTAGGVWPSPEG